MNKVPWAHPALQSPHCGACQEERRLDQDSRAQNSHFNYLCLVATLHIIYIGTLFSLHIFASLVRHIHGSSIELSATSHRVFLDCMHVSKDKDCAYQMVVKDEQHEWESEILHLFICLNLYLELNKLIGKEMKEYIHIFRKILNPQTEGVV